MSFDDALPAFQAAKFFPWIYGQLHSFSPSTIDRLWHSTGSLLRFRDYLVDIVLDLQSNRKNEDKEPCLLHKLMDPSKHTAEPKLSADTLQGEAQTVISGGVESVAHTAVYAAVFVGQDRTIPNRLRVELEQIWPDPVGNIPDLAQLEKLPFLTAVLKESLRLAPGIPTPLPRVVPRNGATIGGQFIPGGVSQFIYIYFHTVTDPRGPHRRSWELPLRCFIIRRICSRMPTCSSQTDGSTRKHRSWITGWCHFPRDPERASA